MSDRHSQEVYRLTHPSRVSVKVMSDVGGLQDLKLSLGVLVLGALLFISLFYLGINIVCSLLGVWNG